MKPVADDPEAPPPGGGGGGEGEGGPGGPGPGPEVPGGPGGNWPPPEDLEGGFWTPEDLAQLSDESAGDPSFVPTDAQPEFQALSGDVNLNPVQQPASVEASGAAAGVQLVPLPGESITLSDPAEADTGQPDVDEDPPANTAFQGGGEEQSAQASSSGLSRLWGMLRQFAGTRRNGGRTR